MELYSQDGDQFTYEYLENEYDEYKEDVREAKKAGILIDSYKGYGCKLYYITVDYKRMKKEYRMNT